MSLDITVEKRTDDAVVVRLSGRLDGASAPELEARCTELVGAAVRILVLDLAAVTYISSAGLRVILVVAKRVKAAAGRCVLCGLTGMVAEVVDMAGFRAIISVTGTVAEALVADHA